MPDTSYPSIQSVDSLFADGAWYEIHHGDLIEWDRRLQNTSASLYQYPFWNEPFRKLFFQPRYLSFWLDNKQVAFVSVLTIGFLGVRIGLIRHGPVSLVEDDNIPEDAWRKLELWAKRQRYIFLRFTGSDEEFLRIASTLKMSRRIDAFPLYPEESEELVVQQQVDDKPMFSALSGEARRQIERAREVGYQIAYSESPGDFASVWPLFELMSSRKHINRRPCSFYQDLMTCGTQAGCCRLYTAKYRGEYVQAILVARAGKTAYLIAAAIDAQKVKDDHSPSYLLHWHAMRDFSNLGATGYHLGNRSSDLVYRFKSRFKPSEIKTVPPVTLVTNPFLFGLWKSSVLKLGRPFLLWMRKNVQRRHN